MEIVDVNINMFCKSLVGQMHAFVFYRQCFINKEQKTLQVIPIS